MPSRRGAFRFPLDMSPQSGYSRLLGPPVLPSRAGRPLLCQEQVPRMDDGTAASLRPRRGEPLWRFLLGGALAVVTLLALAEAYLRCFPPRDLHPYLGEETPLAGLYAPDEDFGITYRSWD